MPQSDLILYINNDQVLSCYAKTKTDDDLSSATVTGTLKDSAGAAVSGADGLTLVASGTELVDEKTYYVFKVTLPYTLSLDADENYTADIAFNGGAGKVNNIEDAPVDVQKRTA